MRSCELLPVIAVTGTFPPLQAPDGALSAGEKYRLLEHDYAVPAALVTGRSTVRITLTQLGDAPWQAEQYVVLTSLRLAAAAGGQPAP